MRQLTVTIAFLISAVGVPAKAPDRAGLAFFETRIRPALVSHCYECHSGEDAKAGLRLDYRGGWVKGGKSGAALIPGDPDGSLLMRVIRHKDSSLKMPKDGDKLPYDQIVDLAEWIRMGAPDPRTQAPSADASLDAAWDFKLASRRNWWSLQPMVSTTPPQTVGVTNTIDQFISAKLGELGLTNAAPAEPETILRRLSFVLTGLPPWPAQVHKFQRAWKRNPDKAIHALVDDLLTSPHFGERFARHWMDVVRYTDTLGYEWDNPLKGAWRYRDYLIRAFNEDVGFDQLVREQIAGDLLPAPRINQKTGVNESILGTLFYHFGEHRHGDSADFNGVHQEMVNNKIDAFSKAFMATTVACARCHDHKLEAVSQKDYYALASVLMSARWTARIADQPGGNDRHIEKLKSLRDQIQDELKSIWKRDAQDFTEILSTITSPTNDIPHNTIEAWKKALSLRRIAGRPAKSPSTNSIAYPLHRLLRVKSDADRKKAWESLRTTWSKWNEKARETNATYFSLLTEFKKPRLPEDWITEGDGIRHGFAKAGTPLIALSGRSAFTNLLERGFHTHALSSKLPGAIRTANLPNLGESNMTIRLGGGEWAGHITVPDNAFQSERVRFMKNNPPVWQQIPTFASDTNRRVRLEIATSGLHPNFPPRTGLARSGRTKLADKDMKENRRSWFSLTDIWLNDRAVAPRDTREYQRALLRKKPTGSEKKTNKRIGKWLQAPVNRWIAGKSSNNDVRILNWLVGNGLLTSKTNATMKLSRLVREYRETEDAIKFPATILSMEERNYEPVEYRLNIRGNVDELGAPVSPDFLSVFRGRNRVAAGKGSGRLELAEFLSASDNPLTARVFVNRVWQWIFGTGLVATPDDFGRLGDRPSHPELLDHLAIEFTKNDWSLKWLIRQMVLSRTFRQSGLNYAKAREADPQNRLLHHYPTRRLEAEAIRDNILAATGRLEPTLYGPAIQPPRKREHSAKRLFSGPLDGSGRRSIYWRVTMMELPSFLVGFNFPDPKLPNGRRDVTNVPAQALMLMNDPFVVGQADWWANHLVADASTSTKQRLGGMLMRAFGRRPTNEELNRWKRALESFQTQNDPTVPSLMRDEKAWAQTAHALFNSKEFIYYR